MTVASGFYRDTSSRLYQLASEVRHKLEQACVDAVLLARLYRGYNPVPDMAEFIERALAIYPRLCCGLASLYLQHCLGDGVVHCGLYGEAQHTFLVARGWLLDITADQFGGPRIHVGPFVPPWRFAPLR